MDLEEVSNEKYIYLTTIGRRTGKPHTVELWFAVDKNRVYLSHEGKYTDWMKNVLKNNHVRFRIGKSYFEGSAQIIEQNECFEAGKQALYQKYYGKASKDVVDDWFSESSVVEITEVTEASSR